MILHRSVCCLGIMKIGSQLLKCLFVDFIDTLRHFHLFFKNLPVTKAANRVRWYLYESRHFHPFPQSSTLSTTPANHESLDKSNSSSTFNRVSVQTLIFNSKHDDAPTRPPSSASQARYSSSSYQLHAIPRASYRVAQQDLEMRCHGI